MTKRILQSQVGRTLDFQSSREDDQPINATIEYVKNGVVSLRYYAVRGNDGLLRIFNPDGFTAYLSVNDPRIIEVY